MPREERIADSPREQHEVKAEQRQQQQAPRERQHPEREQRQQRVDDPDIELDEPVIRALRDESKKDKERIESLTQMNKLLQTVIDQLRKDI